MNGYDEFFGDVGRGPRTSLLNFGGVLDHNPNPGFPIQTDFDGVYHDRWIVNDKSWSPVLFEIKRSSVKVGVSLHPSECQSSIVSKMATCHQVFISGHI